MQIFFTLDHFNNNISPQWWQKSPKMSRSIFTQKLYILKYFNSRAQMGQNHAYKFKCKFFGYEKNDNFFMADWNVV